MSEEMPELEWPDRMYLLHPSIKTLGEMITNPEREEYINAARVAKMVQEARDQAFREAAKAVGDAAVEVLLRQRPDANALMPQARLQSVAVPVLRLIGTPHPEVAKNDG